MARIVAREELISMLKMQAHPEGGFYIETYRSNNKMQCKGKELCVGTSILYLLGREEVNRLHRIKSDEVLSFCAGGSVSIFELVDETKSFRCTILGSHIMNGERLQHVIPANTWFGFYIHDPAAAPYTILTCTACPGFEFENVEFGDRDKLCAEYPGAMDAINRLTDTMNPIAMDPAEVLHTHFPHGKQHQGIEDISVSILGHVQPPHPQPHTT